MINLKDLLKAGVHFGHSTSRWSPKMSPFIWGARNKIHLIDISKTKFLMERSATFLTDVAAQGKCILWVGTKKAAQDSIAAHAQTCKSPYVVHRWIGGTLSNFGQVKKAITRLLHLRDVVGKSLDQYGKKEQSMITKELARLEKNVGGIVDLEYPPGAIVIVDAKKERSALKEALTLGVPVVALVDTNTNPAGIPYIIPGNDDSPKSVDFIMQYLSLAVQKGQELHKTAQEAERAEKAAAKAAKAAAAEKAASEKAERLAKEAKKTDKAQAATPAKKEAKPPAKAPVKKASPASQSASAKPAAPAKASSSPKTKAQAPAKVKASAKQAAPTSKKVAKQAPGKADTKDVKKVAPAK